MGRARSGRARFGMAWQAGLGWGWHGGVWPGKARQGAAGAVRRGLAWQGWVRSGRHGKAGRGGDWLGLAGRGWARQAWPGDAGLGSIWPGQARLGRHGRRGMGRLRAARRSTAGVAWDDGARCGKAWPRVARFGPARQARHGEAGMADEVKETTTAPAATAPSEPRPEIIAGGKVLPLIPRTVEEAVRYARMVITAGAIPDSLAKDSSGKPYPPKELISRVVTVVLAGAEVGLAPMRALASVALINKRAVVWGEGAIALLHASGALEEMVVERIGTDPGNSTPTAQFHDSFGIRIILKRKGQSTPYTGSYTVGQAKRAHLWLNPKKATWTEYPDRMLFWKAFHQAATDGFADCLSGLGIRELVEERPAPPRITDVGFLDGGPVRPTPVKEPDDNNGDGEPDGDEEEEPDEQEEGNDD
jgi:hypothetical protein